MGVYDRQVATALRMIKAKGEPCTWMKIIPPVGGDPGQPADGTPEPHDCIIAFFPNEQLNLLSSGSLIADTEIPSGRLYGIMASVDFTPELNDTVIRSSSGEEYGILGRNGLSELNVNGQSILWTVRFTR